MNQKENEIVLKKDFDIDGYIDKRKEFISKVNGIMVEGKDFHVIQGKKSMAKGGAEKIASIFGWTAQFIKDEDAMTAFSNMQGIICFVCKLSKNKTFIGEGRGAAVLNKNAGDPNKTLKMAQKSAFIDAVLRASGLSDFYTQDLEDMSPYEINKNPLSPERFADAPSVGNGLNNAKASQKQLEFIAELCSDRSNNPQEYLKSIMRSLGVTELTGGRNGTASKIIEKLKSMPKEELPTIQQEPTEQELTLADLAKHGQIVEGEIDPNDVPF